MKIIITMAGDGTRFKNKGINQPKHKIVVKGRTLFEYAMLSLNTFFNNEFIFIGRKEHQNDGFIRDKCLSLGIKKYHIINLSQPTNGQATTVLKAKDLLYNNDSIVIYNIDTYVEADTINQTDIKGDGWIPSFRVAGNRWSFVVTKDSDRVTRVAEKERISDLATIGLYYFSSFKLFQEAYNQWGYGNKEKYIAPLYNHLIKEGLPVFAKIIPSDKVHVLGTPKDVKIFDPDFMNNPYKNI